MGSSDIERISKALANETRLLIFEAISRNKEMTCSTIVALRGVAAAAVSHHLQILSHAGLIECRRQGHLRAVPIRHGQAPVADARSNTVECTTTRDTASAHAFSEI
jgi:predicted transcriptional regulator